MLLQEWQDGEPKGSNAFISRVLSWATGGRIWETTPSSFFFCSWWRARAWVDQVDPKWKRPSTAPWPLLVDTLAKWQMAHITPSATSSSVLQAVAAYNHIIHCFLPLEPPNLSASWLHTCAHTIYCDLALIVRPKTMTKTKTKTIGQTDIMQPSSDCSTSQQVKNQIRKQSQTNMHACVRYNATQLWLSNKSANSNWKMYKKTITNIHVCARRVWDILQLSSAFLFLCLFAYGWCEMKHFLKHSGPMHQMLQLF